nr:MAG TPA: hypothetical protein [Caudoviricetes sp.]
MEKGRGTGHESKDPRQWRYLVSYERPVKKKEARGRKLP